MSQSYPVDSDLTVTVHDDGHVTWSSSFPMTLAAVEKAITTARMHAGQRIRQLDELAVAIRSADSALNADEVMDELQHAIPAWNLPDGPPKLRVSQQLGVVYVEMATPMCPHDSSPYMRQISANLELRGYTCTRSRTRVTVRLGEKLPQREPDFLCTRTA